MLRTLAHTPIILLLLLFPTSCASGPRYRYDDVTLNLPMVGRERVALMVVDQRPQVQSGQYPTSFVGIYQSEPSEQQLVTTKSGLAFADDIGAVLEAALERSGYQVKRLEGRPGLTHAQALSELQAQDVKHLLLLEVIEWQSKTFKNMQIDYRLTLSVQNTGGALKGQATVKGSDQLAPSHADAPSKQSGVAAQALAHKLGILFSNPRVAAAFRRDY